jgi:uncharacterized protein
LFQEWHRKIHHKLSEAAMKRILLSLAILGLAARPARAQNLEVRFIADTLVVQAEGTYETDPDLATLSFSILSQEKDLKQAYDGATQSMQRIAALAERNGVKKEDVSTGALQVAPSYGGDRKKKPRSYLVRGQIALKIHDFSRIGPILDGSVEDGIADFRSLTYSLVDEEAAKQRAVAEAMHRAVGRASAALGQKGQKVGALRYASLDVKQLVGVAQIGMMAQTVEVQAEGFGTQRKMMAAPIPPVAPEKITVSATVQCAFQIL